MILAYKISVDLVSDFGQSESFMFWLMYVCIIQSKKTKNKLFTGCLRIHSSPTHIRMSMPQCPDWELMQMYHCIIHSDAVNCGYHTYHLFVIFNDQFPNLLHNLFWYWKGGATKNVKKRINWLQCHQELKKIRSTVPDYSKHFAIENKFYSTYWRNWSISYLESRRAYQSSTVEDWNQTPTLARNTANPHNSYIATSQNAGIGNHIGHHSSKRNRFPVHHTFAVYESIAYM